MPTLDPLARGSMTSDVVITPDGSTVYATAMGTHNVFVIDTKTNQVTNVIDLSQSGFNGTWPFREAISPDGKLIYVANAISKNISVIQTSTKSVITTINIDYPVHDVVFEPKGEFAYVELGLDRVLVVDVTANRVVSSVSLDKDIHTFTLATSHDGKNVYVASQIPAGAGIYVIQTDTNQLVDRITLNVELTNQGMISLSADDSKLYLPCGITGTSYTRPTEGVNLIYVVDLRTKSLASRIPVVGGPIAIRLSPDGKFGYVSTFAARMVAVVDLINNLSVGQIDWGDIRQDQGRTDLRDMVLTPDNSRLYIAAWDGNAVLVADLAARRMINIIELNSLSLYMYEIAISPDGKKVYAASQETTGSKGSLFAVNTSTNLTVSAIRPNIYPSSPTISSDGKLLYCISGRTIVVVDVQSDTIVRQINLPSSGVYYYDIALAEDRQKAYVTDVRDQYVYAIDLNSGAVLNKISVGWYPQMVILTRDKTKVYVSRQFNPYDNGGLVAIDPATDTVSARMEPPAGTRGPTGRHDLLANSPEGKYIYWSTSGSGFYILNVGTNAVVRFVDLNVPIIDTDWGSPRGIHPTDVAFSPDGTRAYIPCGDAYYVDVLDLSTFTIVDRILDVGIEPVAIVITPDGRHAYVTNKNEENLSVIDLGSNKVVAKIPVLGPYGKSSVPFALSMGAVGESSTIGDMTTLRTGYASVDMASGAAPYGTAVFSFKENGVTVSEAGVPASPPTTNARIFIDYRSAVQAIPGRISAGTIDIDTGMAVVNPGSVAANVTYTLRDLFGVTLASGHGTVAAHAHFAKFITQLMDVAPDYNLPPDFQIGSQFGSLEISSDEPLSIVALRQTTNQRNEALFTTTPIADLTQPLNSAPMFFPQFADGGGYTTALILLNTSTQIEAGTFFLLDEEGSPLIVSQVGGTADSSFRYLIPAGGAFRFQTDGFPPITKVGWVQLTPDAGTPTPIGAGVFSFNPGNVLVTESGIAAATLTTHARIYVDLSGRHNTGLAVANPGNTNSNIAIEAFQEDGVTEIGTSQGPILLAANGHSARFADQLIRNLPAGFTGVLDISSATPFVALTERSLKNERNDFLLTTFPIADQNQPARTPIVFPQIADGSGYVTQLILIGAGGETSVMTLNFYGEDGTPLRIGK